MMTSRARPRLLTRMHPLLFVVQMFVRILHHDDGAIDHDPNRNRDPAQTHDIGVDTNQVHREDAD